MIGDKGYDFNHLVTECKGKIFSVLVIGVKGIYFNYCVTENKGKDFNVRVIKCKGKDLSV